MKLALSLLATLFLNGAHAETSTTTARYALKYDFSKLLTPKKEFLGFVDPEYQRLHMKFTSVKRGADPLLYTVKGTTRVKNNACTFSGTIHVEEISEYTTLHYGVDDEFKTKGVQAEGEFIGAYEIKEDPGKKNCGIFDGKMKLLWYVDKKGDITYDDIESQSDSYSNNQYTGTWRAYNSENKKTANWGEFRIPNSGDLDVGAAEFSANPKYKTHGWE